jgi:glycosyltransferase involved in cell wall biosynthesis
MGQIENQRAADIAAIRRSRLLLADWYRAGRPHLAADADVVEDFCTSGWREGAAPNPYFNPAFYLAENPDVRAAGFNPLWHYIEFGELEGRDPCPFFDVAWYRKTYQIQGRALALAHFLEHRFTGQVAPVPMFDPAYYFENNPDVAAGGADPFEHFLVFGAAEGRNPAAEFDVAFYATRYAKALHGQNPLLHYLANRDGGGFFPRRPVHEELIPGAVRQATRPSPAFEEVRALPPGAVPGAKLLAYYLPQFHRVAENDAWWGQGFTDWTNLARAVPRYTGHLQPRAPRDLGYYSLDDPAVLRRQIDLAKGAGVFGFVFYYYWFNGHRLLEKPLEQMLAGTSLEFPFCVMWANENWTRRWDGLEREILIAQEYRKSDDAGLIASFARLFADARYIRVQGRPLLMIYRIDLVPDAAARLQAWRGLFAENHGENPIIIMAQSLGDYDPTPYGLDGAIEFPPHKLSQACEKINDTLDLIDPDFAAAVYEYEDIAKASLAFIPPKYPLIKTVAPGWDNEPRREGKGLVIAGATPAKYQAWLEQLVAHTAQHRFFGERFVAVNAWNEWAEGAFLEPDLHFGGAFLNATARALCPGAMAGGANKILLVGHDAHPHGAQMLLLHIARHLRAQFGMQVHLLLLGVGPLVRKYQETAEVSVAHVRPIIENLLDRYREMGIRAALVNSAASARVAPWLAERGIAPTLLVHEMPRLLKEYNLEIQARLGGEAAAHMVFSSGYVQQVFCNAVGLTGANAVVLPQGNYQNVTFDAAARQQVRRALGISDREFLIIGVGFGDFRKGFDLFLQAARMLADPKTHFLWVGEINFSLATYLGPEMAAANFHHIGFSDDVRQYYSAADVYALPSREDPYPTVVLEALSCGVPCVAFDEAGGIPALLREYDAGVVVPPGDIAAFSAALAGLLNHKKLAASRARLMAMAAAQFSFPRYVEALLRLVKPELRTVSVCVLNYNYARYLPARLESIFAQSYPVAEILFLDDASSDESVAAAARIAQNARREMRMIVNERNSGSVFAQWRRAAQAARGDYIWIAEADDDCAPALLEALVDAMAALAEPVLGFADSRAVDADGAAVMPSYKSYYFEAGARELASSRSWPADEFARKFLSERNLILNASGVLWRRAALLAALQACDDLNTWQVAGDWRVYLQALTAGEGQVAYVAIPLNIYRRHQGGVTQGLDGTVHAGEISRMQAIAAEKLGLNAGQKAAQARYLAAVSRQLAAKPARRQGAPKPGNAGAAILARRRKV